MKGFTLYPLSYSNSCWNDSWGRVCGGCGNAFGYTKPNIVLRPQALPDSLRKVFTRRERLWCCVNTPRKNTVFPSPLMSVKGQAKLASGASLTVAQHKPRGGLRASACPSPPERGELNFICDEGHYRLRFFLSQVVNWCPGWTA